MSRSGDNRLSGVTRLRSDQEQSYHPHQDPATLPSVDQAVPVYREEDRENQGGGEKQAAGPVCAGDQLQRPAQGQGQLHHARVRLPSGEYLSCSGWSN